VGVTRITSLKNDFKTPEKRAAAPGVLDFTILYFDFYA
jgi:hypothetical protein